MRLVIISIFALLAAAGFAGEAIDAGVGQNASGTTGTKLDEATGLKIDTGWEQVRAHCGGCHSHALVTGQRADRQTWLDMIRWMQATQNLWQFEPATEVAILDYLAANYPPQPNRRRAPIPTSLLPQSPRDSN